MSTITLPSKVAIVTGGSRGIGAAITRTLATRGARVVVNYTRQREPADALVGEIERQGGEAIAVGADVSKDGAMATLFDAAIARFGRVDILVNNAGVIVEKLLVDTTDDDFATLFDINVKGTFAGLREAGRRLADGGRVINLSTTLTRLMMPTYGAYAATKGAVDQLTRYAAKELGGRGITVNAVLPGPTDTELLRQHGTPEEVEQRLKVMAGLAPLGRLGQVDDIARVVAFLASDDAGWVTGQLLGVNGGLA